ncbi:MAG: hypothetical protein JWM93_504 [Frankiales bacterium]|nr:hypothetical protein [Frankiales bacterium]
MGGLRLISAGAPADQSRVRPYLLVAMLAGMAWLAYRQLTHGRDHVRLIAALAVVFAVTGVFEYQWRQTDGRYSSVARALLRDPHTVAVHCERLGQALMSVSQLEGYVPYEEDGSLPKKAQLMRNVCHDLGDWIRSDKKHTTIKQVQALHVFVHEAMHLDGIYSEAEAECQAMQRTEHAAVLFGAPAGVGQRMALAYWQSVYPDMPPEYTGGCTPNGAGDDTPNDGVWP